jgi:hypothetical protein
MFWNKAWYKPLAAHKATPLSHWATALILSQFYLYM